MANFNHDVNFSHFRSLWANFGSNLRFVHPKRGPIPVQVRKDSDSPVVRIGYTATNGRFEQILAAHVDSHFGRRVGNCIVYGGVNTNYTFVIHSSTGDVVCAS